jgi:hypothetical protein
MQKIAILYDASQAVLSTFELDEVLNQILAIARDYFRLQSGAILLRDEVTGNLIIRSTCLTSRKTRDTLQVSAQRNQRLRSR